MNENEILATHQVQADGLNGKDAKETKQLQTVRGRSPNPAPDCFADRFYESISKTIT